MALSKNELRLLRNIAIDITKRIPIYPDRANFLWPILDRNEPDKCGLKRSETPKIQERDDGQ